MTILDRHTAQLKQLANAVGQLTAIATQQSDNISFLLREHVIIKADVAEIRTDVSEIKQMQQEVHGKLDLLLKKLA